MTADVGPFARPAGVVTRRHGPSGYEDYRSFKPWLRDDFTFRCVYCLERELWYPDRSDSFSVDHVLPQSRRPDLVCEYSNMLYACTRCNSARTDLTLLDPTGVAFGDHLTCGDSAELVGLTAEGRVLIDTLGLNEDPALAVRKAVLTLLTLKERYPADAEADELFRSAFGFPTDLPNLKALRPPGGNDRPEGVEQSYHARRERGELPDTY